MKERTGRIIAQLPVDVGTYLLNEKRLAVREIEARYRTYVTLVPNPTLPTPNYEIKRVRADFMQMDGNSDTISQLVPHFAAKAQEEPGKRPLAHQRVLPPPPSNQLLPFSPEPPTTPTPLHAS